ncbi:MAG TPA: hypothetical protein V6D09_05980 [Leptolyngbyaceae cyanobacterium]
MQTFLVFLGDRYANSLICLVFFRNFGRCQQFQLVLLFAVYLKMAELWDVLPELRDRTPSAIDLLQSRSLQPIHPSF